MSSLFTFSLVTYLLGLQSLLSHGFPLTNSLDSLPERSLNGRQVVPDPIDALNTTFDSPALQKRAKIESTYDIPGVDACVKQVQAKGLVEKLPSVYYTGYPLQLTAAKQWASCHFQETESPEPQDYKFAAWRRIVDNKWAASVSFQIGEQMLETEPEFPDDLQKQFKDQFLKELSQAYAEESQGEVFLVVKDSVTSDDVSWDTTKAWGGWEYPALTRNTKVTKILRVDPDTDDEPRVIWTQGQDGKSSQEPKGVRGPTTPSFETD